VQGEGVFTSTLTALQNFLKHRVDPREHAVIPEPQNPNPAAARNPFACVPPRFPPLAAGEFYYQPAFRATEVRAVRFPRPAGRHARNLGQILSSASVWSRRKVASA